MHRSAHYAIVLLMVAALVTAPTAGLAMSGSDYFEDSQYEAGSMAADALVVRPLSIVATVAGFGLFIVSSPFSLLGGNAKEAWSALVIDPAKFTFTRPLGDFD